MGSEEKAEQAFETVGRLHRTFAESAGTDALLAEQRTNAALGQNILREEIGFFGPWEGPSYRFDQETRDRLLAHGRQDVASAYAMAQSAFREAHNARLAATKALLTTRVLLVLCVAILVSLWWG